MDKKASERWALDRVRELLNILPGADIQNNEERPDFIVRVDGRTIGIEVTVWHELPSPGHLPAQAVEGSQDAVVSAAGRLYQQEGHPPVYCTVMMGNTHVKNFDRKAFALALKNLVVKNIPTMGSSIHIVPGLDKDAGVLRTVAGVFIDRYPFMNDYHFHAPGGTWVGAINDKDIQRILDPKDKLCREVYRMRCDEVWLLIVSDIGKNPSTWFEHNAEWPATTFKTAFDRVFMLRQFHGLATELKVEKTN